MPEASHPTATTLRLRAEELRRYATAIETARVFALDQPATPDDTRRIALCRRLLARNLHQLLEAADDLRSHAWQLDMRAQHLTLKAAS